MANASVEAYESRMAEELKNEAETVLERGLATVTGSAKRREVQEPIAQAVTGALFDDGVMFHLLQTLQAAPSAEEALRRVNALRMSIAKQIGEDNALGVVEARFAPLLAAMEDA